ncbi:MAG: hypothetical protein VZR53_12360 [Prevotella sp.]|nr:hypothetical protein [Prevotella sp.]
MALQPAFTLTASEIFQTLACMIISQEVFADNLGKHQTLIDKARVEGTLYGDTKLYYATDVLKSHDWLNDAEAPYLLQLDRPQDPAVQAIKLDKFRQIRLTTDNYMTKRAFSDEGAFASFNGVMLGWMRETKRVYEGTLYNTYIGTTEADGKDQFGNQVQPVGYATRTVDITTATSGLTGIEKAQMTAMVVAQDLANLLVEMGDYSRDFNDYGYLRSYADESIKVIWNAKFVNQIKKVDLPTIFHKEGLVDKFEEEVLPARYFGTVITSANVANFSAATPTTGKPIDSDDNTYVPGANHANGCIRSLIEADVTVGATAYHVFPGDEIPAGATIAASSATFAYGDVYIEQADIMYKVVVKLPVIMSAFEVGTTWFNARSLTENHYVTWAFNTLQYFKNYPFITVKAV